MPECEPDDARALVAGLLPNGVVVATANRHDWSGELLPQESACIAGASEKRRREFTAGRVCARRALERLGVKDHPLLPRAERYPAWPPNVVGCISHCDGCCIAAVARSRVTRGLGIDVERAEPLNFELRSIICTEAELARTPQLPRRFTADVWKLLFAAKEAFFKCYYPLTHTWLDFKDVEIEFDLDAGAFVGRLTDSSAPALFGSRELGGRFAAAGRFVFAGVHVGPAR